MPATLEIAFFGSSLVSAYWNGAATYYRGLLRALARRGHRITFYEPDAYDRQAHRDIPDPDWAHVVVYPATEAGMRASLDAARNADVVVKASGVGVLDDALEAGVVALRRPGVRVAFWDVDAPATLARLTSNPADPFAALVPEYDFIFTYGGGPPVVRAYLAHGARTCTPIYNAVDPATHHPVPREARFACDLSFMGNRLPDRELRVDEFFWKPAQELSGRHFILGGAGWGDRPMPKNVTYLGHVYTRDHNTLNASSLAVLNISRDSMASCGYSPATRVFEAAGAGACIITDAWEGIGEFLEPGRELLVAQSGREVAELVDALSPERAQRIGEAAKKRVLSHHTYERRAELVERLLADGGLDDSQALVSA